MSFDFTTFLLDPNSKSDPGSVFGCTPILTGNPGPDPVFDHDVPRLEQLTPGNYNQIII